MSRPETSGQVHRLAFLYKEQPEKEKFKNDLET